MIRFCIYGGIICFVSLARAEEAEVPDYGVDISWPMHHQRVSTNYPWLPHNMDPSIPTPDEYKDMAIQPLGDVQRRSEEYIKGCYDYYEKLRGKGNRCLEGERQRVTMTLRQPRSMRNYTKTGFTKIRAPDHVFNLLKEFWEKNKDKESPENWSTGNIYTNHWLAPSTMVSVEDPELEGGGYVLKQHIWNAARDTIEAWTGQKQAECSLYGIRVYKEGAILAPHVDRNPLVSSAIINVDQDVDEPWPLEVIGHDGRAHNVTMEPGDLVLYESHSVIHGRQFPLKGRFMANVFIHFEPVGPIDGAVEADGDLPPYVIPGSEEEDVWRAANPDGHNLVKTFTLGSTDAHRHAQVGDMESLERFLNENQDAVTHRDSNGWTPLAEAVRHGNESVVQFLLDRGSEVNIRLGDEEQGGTLLWLAKQYHGDVHPVVDLLQSRGGRDAPPTSYHDEL